jgi:TP901 family phage tail tape measure protein
VAESRLDVLIRLRDQITAGLKNIKRGFDEVDKSAEAVENVDTTKSQAQVQTLQQRITAIRTETERLNSALSTIQQAGLAIAGLGAALVAPFAAGLRAAAEFSVQIAEVATLVNEADQSTEQLRETVVNLSDEFGADRADVARGLYQAISSGAAAGAEANEILRVALVTARGGVTSTTAAVNGLSTVLNSFGLGARDAEQVADSLFVTVKNGRTTIDELSRFLFQAAPVASQLGISYQELNAALVTLTKQGVPTRVAFTQIRSAINGLVRDTPELTKAFEEYGGAQKVIAEQGLARALEIARDAADGNVGVLNKLLGSIEGVGAVLGLTGDQLDEFIDQIRQQNEASGDAQQAADKVADAFGTQLREAIQQVSNLFEELGTVLVDIGIGDFIAGIGRAASALRKLVSNNDAVRFFAAFVAGVGALLLVLGSLVTTLALVGRGLVNIRGSLAIATASTGGFAVAARGASVALRLLGGALRFALGPIGLAITALGFLLTSTDSLAESTEELIETNKELRDSFEVLDDAAQVRAIKNLEDGITNLEKREADLIKRRDELANKKFNLFGEKPEEVDIQITGVQDELTAARAELETFKKRFEEINEAAIDFSELGIRKIKEGIEGLNDDITEAQEELDKLGDVETQPIGPTGDDVRAAGIAGANRLAEERDLLRVARNERRAALQAEIDSTRVVIAQRERELEVAEAMRASADKVAKDEADRVALLERAVELREKEVNAAKRVQSLLKAQQQAQERVARAADKVAQQEDERALEAGEIDTTEFERRARQRIAEALARQQQAALDELAAARATTQAQIAELLAEEALTAGTDDAVDNSEKILDLENKLAGTEVAIRAGLEEASLNAAVALREVGVDAAEGLVEGFEEGVSGISEALRTELARLKAELDAGLISQQQFADGVAAANQKAADSYETLRAKIVEALDKIADPEIRAALAALLRDLDIQVATLGQNVSVFEQRLRTAVEGELGTFFETVITDIDDVNEAFTQLFINIGQQVRRLIAEKLAEKLTASLFGDGSVLGGFLGSGGGEVPTASKGGYIEAAKGGYVPRRTPQTRRTAIFARAGGIVLADRLKSAQGVSVPHMARGGKYEDEDERRRRAAYNAGGFIRAATGGSIVDRSIRWTRDDHSTHTGSVSSRVRDDHSRVGSRHLYKARRGGGVLKLADGGGRVRGPGTKVSDSVPALLSAGEYVVKAAAVDRYGVNFLEALNRGLVDRRDTKTPRRKLTVTRPTRKAFAEGGLVVSAPSAGGQAQGGSSQGLQNAAQSGANTMKLEVNEATLNLTMRDFLEREFGNILASR